MPIIPKVYKPNHAKSHSYLQYSFTNVRGLRSSFYEGESSEHFRNKPRLCMMKKREKLYTKCTIVIG